MKILLTVLDWGLGHATRSMHLIGELIERKHEVFLASSGLAGDLLKGSYPNLPYLPLPPYNVFYSRYLDQGLAVLLQSPTILKRIKQEQAQVQHYHQIHQFDRIISDHRYGCVLPDIPSVFLSHQLALIPPKGFGWMRKWIFGRHISLLKKFGEIWIPDFEGKDSLSGTLSQRFKIEKKHRFIGPLSRFNHLKPTNVEAEHSFKAVAVISGPEPQRSILERKVIQLLKGEKQKCLVLQGKPLLGAPWSDGASGFGETVFEDDNLIIINHLDSTRLMELLSKAEVVISRSGYTSIMDYAALGLKKVVLVPTPGQSEQEYLAAELHHKRRVYSVVQDQMSLESIRAGLDSRIGFYQTEPRGLLKKALDEWL